MPPSDFGDKPKKMLAAFRKMDPKGTKKVRAELALTLLTKFAGTGDKDLFLSMEEVKEFIEEAADGDSKGTINYEEFVNDIVFGEVK